MLFNSYTFLVFLTIILIVYYSTSDWNKRKFLLLISSYIFYSAWNPPFVILLWISTVLDWTAAKKIYASSKKKYKISWLLFSLFVNLGLLIFFKYGNFILENINFISPRLYNFESYSIILPVGISFYTFQTLSYTLDIYKGNAKPCKSFLDYALYVTFFPQLVAGPIVRSDEFLAQCEIEKPFYWSNLGKGIFWLTTGLFLKIVVADYLLAPVVEIVFGTNGKVDVVSSWIGTLAFSSQILCDFAGYSICAIGVAKMLGFSLPKNFKFPYASKGFSEFWRRWHISLSSWLRDYVYIPLGGNRKTNLRTYENLMVTMLIGGLWHGASWTFIFWGFLHGAFLAIERLLIKRLNFDRIPNFIRIAFVFILTCITWVFFRADSFTQAWNLISSMVGIEGGQSLLSLRDVLVVLFVTITMLISSYLFRNLDLEFEISQIKWWKVSLILSFLVFFIVTLSGEDQSFIYFQF